ncbi:MAG: GSU2403 family nucleotidyltransferase fold protein, partial [Alphaproteobacteria bacterium]
MSKALGLADNPEVSAEAENIRAHQNLAKEDATTISILKRKYIPAPTTDLGYVLDSLSYAGIFDNAVLVGTAAYQCYAPVIGMFLPSASLTTQDADIAAARLAVDSKISEKT